MKALFTILLTATLGAATTCHSSLQSEIEELHTTSAKTGEVFLPKLETLVQQSNSINIQGRALTPEELEFTSKIVELQNDFAKWKAAMEKIAAEKPDSARLGMEQSMYRDILNLTEQVDNLTSKN